MAHASFPTVTLTTDFGRQDFHLPRLKGALLAAAGTLRLVDLNHEIPPFDIVRAAFIFNRVWAHFPAGTVHLVSVNDYYRAEPRYLAISKGGHYFIGPDNGIFSLIFGKMPAESYVIDDVRPEDNLPAIYARAVAHIADGKPFYEVGLPTTKFTDRLGLQPVIGTDYIRGTVTFIDRFDNVTTNITRERFEAIGAGRPFELLVKRMPSLTRLSARYHDVSPGETLCRFSSDGLLEIAINTGRAASLLSIQEEDMVQVQFL